MWYNGNKSKRDDIQKGCRLFCVQKKQKGQQALFCAGAKTEVRKQCLFINDAADAGNGCRQALSAPALRTDTGNTTKVVVIKKRKLFMQAVNGIV